MEMSRVAVMQMRFSIGNLLARVIYRNEGFVIERYGKPVAALVPLEEVEHMKRFTPQSVAGGTEDGGEDDHGKTS